MQQYVTIYPAAIDAESPITESLMAAQSRNPQAIAERSPNAPWTNLGRMAIYEVAGEYTLTLPATCHSFKIHMAGAYGSITDDEGGTADGYTQQQWADAASGGASRVIIESADKYLTVIAQGGKGYALGQGGATSQTSNKGLAAYTAPSNKTLISNITEIWEPQHNNKPLYLNGTDVERKESGSGYSVLSIVGSVTHGNRAPEVKSFYINMNHAQAVDEGQFALTIKVGSRGEPAAAGWWDNHGAYDQDGFGHFGANEGWVIIEY